MRMTENDTFGSDHAVLAERISSAAAVTGVTPALFGIAMQALYVLLRDLTVALDD